MPGPAAVAEEARAKLNLYLYVTGRRADGYHLLDSLAVFPAVGDRLTAATAGDLSLSVTGPFASDVPVGGDNLVLRAAAALAPQAAGQGAALALEKNLPAASGIGGGSADAAAALRALNRLWGLGLGEVALERTGAALGADVPVCVGARPRLMRGIGDKLAEAPALPLAWLALVNPGVAASTPEVFRRREGPFSPPAAPPPGFADARALADWLGGLRNDLEAPALALAPVIRDVLAALGAQPGALLTRMSGSGATCFSLFAEEAPARAAARAIAAMRPGWWTAAAAF